jgi:membrane protein YdbS with pleckstrin-like domain
MLTRASDFKEKEQQAGRPLTRMADIINDRASITVAIGAGLAYLFAVAAFAWVWDLVATPVLYILIFGAIAVLFSITLHYKLRVWKSAADARTPAPS